MAIDDDNLVVDQTVVGLTTCMHVVVSNVICVSVVALRKVYQYSLLKLYQHSSLVPRPLPDFISQPWRKIGRRPGTIYVTDRKWWTRSYVMWTRFHNDGNVPTQYAASTPSDLTVKFV